MTDGQAYDAYRRAAPSRALGRGGDTIPRDRADSGRGPARLSAIDGPCKEEIRPEIPAVTPCSCALWHPSRVRRVFIVSGGIASLNPRLLSIIPSGCSPLRLRGFCRFCRRTPYDRSALPCLICRYASPAGYAYSVFQKSCPIGCCNHAWKTRHHGTRLLKITLNENVLASMHLSPSRISCFYVRKELNP